MGVGDVGSNQWDRVGLNRRELRDRKETGGCGLAALGPTAKLNLPSCTERFIIFFWPVPHGIGLYLSAGRVTSEGGVIWKVLWESELTHVTLRHIRVTWAGGARPFGLV